MCRKVTLCSSNANQWFKVSKDELVGRGCVYMIVRFCSLQPSNYWQILLMALCLVSDVRLCIVKFSIVRSEKREHDNRLKVVFVKNFPFMFEIYFLFSFFLSLEHICETVMITPSLSGCLCGCDQSVSWFPWW